MIYKSDSYEFKFYSYRKEQSKTRGKCREKIGKEYDQISPIIKKRSVIYKLI